MAYDKVVDSAKLDGVLTAIADAIRSKTGESSRLTLEDMETIIAAFQTVNPDIIKIDCGEYIPTSDVTDDTPVWVNHNLGVVPTCSIVVAEGMTSNSSQSDLLCIFQTSYVNGKSVLLTNKNATWFYDSKYGMTSTKITVKGYDVSGSTILGVLRAGRKYTWIAIKVVM